MHVTTDGNIDAEASPPNNPGINFTIQAPTPEPLFPADLIEECLEEFFRNYKFDSPPRKRWSRGRVRLGSSTIQAVTPCDISGRWSAATTDSEYFSESAMLTDGGLNRGRSFTVRIYESGTLSDDASNSGSNGEDGSMGEDYDSLSTDAWSDDGRPGGKGSGYQGEFISEGASGVPHVSAPDEEQLASDDGYHADYDGDDSEAPTALADLFSDAGRDSALYPTDAVFYSQSSDEYDTDYDDCYSQPPRCDSPNVDEVNQRFNESLWATM